MVLEGQLSNSSPPPLLRALQAYRDLNITGQAALEPRSAHAKQALRLSAAQLGRLVARYQSGATVYELAAEFSVERRTVAVQLKRQGVTLRRQSPTADEVDEMIRLYRSGLSLAAVGLHLGFVARTVQRYLRGRGMQLRDTRGRNRS